jgi:hypothetical protein
MKSISTIVWQGSYHGHEITIERTRGKPWGNVPRRRKFKCSTLGVNADGYSSIDAAKDGAIKIINRHLDDVVREWFRIRFTEELDDYVSASQRYDELFAIMSDPRSSPQEAYYAQSAVHLIGQLRLFRILEEAFQDVEAAHSEKADLTCSEQEAEKIRKLEALRDDRKAYPGEVENAKAAIARIRAGSRK